jgi:hypothetical protein
MRNIVPHRLEMWLTEQMGDVVLASGKVIVDAQYVVALGEQALTQVRTKKPGAAGNENPLGNDTAHIEGTFEGAR